MMALIALWAVLGSAALLLGHAILSAGLSKPRELRRGDWLLLSLWLGLIALAWLALVTSLLVPVTPWSLLPLTGLLAIASLARPRGLFANLHSFVRRDVVLAGLSIVIAAGYVAAGLRPTPDTGEYHYPAIRWFAEFGTVTGVAHIILRLGFISSLWPLLAPFDAVLPGRAVAVVNGFILCMVMGQTVLAVARIGAGRARPSDWFLASASLGCLALGTVVGSFTTATPDLMVMTLTILAAWSIFIWYEQRGGLDALVPLLLACGALLAKLSGLPLLPAATLFAVWGHGWRRWATVAAIGALLIAPYFIASVLASGCLAMPSTASCLPVPWALPVEAVSGMGRAVYEWSRWAGPMPAGAGAWSWVYPWLTGRPHWLNAAVFWPFVVSLAAYLWLAGRKHGAAERWVLALILPSLAVVFIAAPDLRFNFGLFVIPAALLVMRLAIRAPYGTPALRPLSRPATVALVLAALQLSFAFAIDRRHGAALDTDRLLRPRPAPAIGVRSHESSGFRYAVPVEGSACWGAALPCAERPLHQVTLRAPERGIAAGFQRK